MSEKHQSLLHVSSSLLTPPAPPPHCFCWFSFLSFLLILFLLPILPLHLLLCPVCCVHVVYVSTSHSSDCVSALVTLATPHVPDVDLELFEAGRLADVTRRVVGDAVAAAHRVVVVAVAHDVAHAAGRTNTNK